MRRSIPLTDFKKIQLKLLDDLGKEPLALPCLLLMETGARPNEIAKTTIDQYFQLGNYFCLKLKASKDSKNRIAKTLSKDSFEFTLNSFQQYNACLAKVLVPSASIESFLRYLRAYFESISLETTGQKYLLYELRHTVGFSVTKELGVMVAKEVLGHKNLESTVHYLNDIEADKGFEAWGKVLRA